MNHAYSVSIAWSKVDGAFIAASAELPGAVAQGNTHNEALANLMERVDGWLAVAKAIGGELPEPLTYEDFDQWTTLADCIPDRDTSC